MLRIQKFKPHAIVPEMPQGNVKGLFEFNLLIIHINRTLCQPIFQEIFFVDELAQIFRTDQNTLHMVLLYVNKKGIFVLLLNLISII